MLSESCVLSEVEDALAIGQLRPSYCTVMSEATVHTEVYVYIYIIRVHGTPNNVTPIKQLFIGLPLHCMQINVQGLMR